ncbi:hypothetical protein HYH03_018646 [Edaphochlamys debaryana]|uniref:Uncharacterized protein n=1 Tax=Edaphochlamys debaryana TaxID=47281 RepID=A0A836BMQ7_9CHLO|nr:hypothetical protein HYH03_018646 [Edaphochlamys debaryana]|eukprot:KAG2482411.1 hypothetical protein HYH03_018646 [Edaphochlamys debaryana]
MSLRRAYKSLAQHVQALDVETRHLPTVLERTEEAGVTPEFVAEQTRTAAVVAAAVYGTNRLLRAARVQDAGPLTALLALLGAGFVGLRAVFGALGRLGAVAGRRRRAQEELRADLRAVMERVQIMLGLAESGLRLHRLHATQLSMAPQQPFPQPLSAGPGPLPAPPSSAGPGPGSYAQPPFPQRAPYPAGPPREPQNAGPGPGSGYMAVFPPPPPPALAERRASDEGWGPAGGKGEAEGWAPQPQAEADDEWGPAAPTLPVQRGPPKAAPAQQQQQGGRRYPAVPAGAAV